MLSCKKGIVNIDGPDYEIEADLVVLIHAVDRTYSKRFGKEEAQERLKRCYDLAMDEENRNIVSDDEIPKAEELIKALKKLGEMLSDICKESEENKEWRLIIH